jgi:hypothetical protein
MRHAPIVDCPLSRDAINAPETHNMPQAGSSYKKLLAYCEGGSGSSNDPLPGRQENASQEDASLTY